MWHTGRSERTCRLPACLNVIVFQAAVDYNVPPALGSIYQSLAMHGEHII